MELGSKDWRIRRSVVLAVGTALVVASAMATGMPAQATSSTTGQLVGSAPDVNMFMGTTKVEVGARPNGSFGSNIGAPVPPYHPRTSDGSILGFRANPGECNWDAADCFTQGDFFTPGTPYEGWGVQIADSAAKFNDSDTSDIAGGFTSLDSTKPSAVWESSSPVDGAISIRQEYSTPTYSWLVNAVVTLTNTSGATVNDIYYMRAVDPDNCVMDPDRTGPPPPLCTAIDGSLVPSTYDTKNTVSSQGADGGVALVTASQTDDTQLALRLASPTAKAFVNKAGLFGPGNLKAAYAGSDANLVDAVGSPATYDDVGISIVDRIDSLEPGQSKTLKIQYTLKEGTPVEPVPVLNLTPNPVDFGSTAAGTSVDRTVTVTNTGEVAGVLSGITPTGAGIASSGGTCAVGGTVAGGGGTCTVDLRWAPTAVGALADGLLTVTYTGAPAAVRASYTASVPLTGTAVEPPQPIAQKPIRALGLPSKIDPKGLTRIVRAKVRTNADQIARVRVTCVPLLRVVPTGDVRGCRVLRSKGAYWVRTFGQPSLVRVVITAPATTGYTAYRKVKTWRVR